MKKLILIFVSLFILNGSFAQNNQKGDFEIHAGLGFGVYGITSNDFEDNNSSGVPGLVSLGVSYQLSEKWNLGLNYERLGFLTEADSNEKAVANNIGVIIGYNIVNNEKNVININLETGFSSFRYDDFKEEEYVIGTGPEFQLGGTWKHYWGDHLGMYLGMSIPYFYYSEFKNKDGDALEVFSI
jgi:hypothetical protein